MIGGFNIKRGTMSEDIRCDDVSDVAGLSAFAEEWDLKQGSVAYVIATGEVYMMQSDKTWVKQ